MSIVICIVQSWKLEWTSRSERLVNRGLVNFNSPIPVIRSVISVKINSWIRLILCQCLKINRGGMMCCFRGPFFKKLFSPVISAFLPFQECFWIFFRILLWFSKEPLPLHSDHVIKVCYVKCKVFIDATDGVRPHVCVFSKLKVIIRKKYLTTCTLCDKPLHFVEDINGKHYKKGFLDLNV